MNRTFVYGSCVSRDTFEFLQPQGYVLDSYVARQSLISAFSPLPPSDLPEVHIASAFQLRMLEGDWAGSLPPLLEESAPQVDVLLWDLCDERLGVRQLGDAPPWRFATRSVDSIRSGLDELLSDRPAWTPDQHRFQEVFKHSAERFGALLSEWGLLAKTILVAPPWATTTSTGEPTPSSFGWTADCANEVFSHLHEYLQVQLGIPVVTLPAPQVTASDSHQWGLAPFHYTDDVYLSLSTQIRTLLEGEGSLL